MVNGPPTPPATTPAELQDEARTNPSNPATARHSSQSAPQSRPEQYQSILLLIGDAISANDFSRLARIAEEADIHAGSDRQQSRLLIVAPLVLGLLVLDQLSPARYALSRLPDNLVSLPLPRALADLVTATTNREHSKVYHQAGALLNLVGQPEFLDRDLASIIANLVPAFIDSFRSRTFTLLSKAYTSLSLSLAGTYLALTAEQIITAAEKNGWSYNPPTQILSPAAGGRQFGSLPADFTSLQTFHFVADSVARLEG